MSEYITVLEETKAKLLAIVNDTEGWSKCQNVSKVLITKKKSPYFAGNMFKAEVEIDAHFEKAAKTWAPKPLGLRQEWDRSVTSSDAIQQIGPNKEGIVLRTITPKAAMGMIASREFIDAMMLLCPDNEELAMTVGISVEHPDYPVISEFVRGKNYPCGALFRKVAWDKTKVTYIGHTSIGGDLPLSLVESAMPSQIHTMLDTFRKMLAQ